MRSFIIKWLILLIGVSASGALESYAANGEVTAANVKDQAHANVEDGDHPHTGNECNDHCARHQCHLSHCKYSPLAYTISIIAPVGAAFVFLPPVGMASDDFPSGLMRPPSV